MHLLLQQQHGEKCTDRACAQDCGFRRLHAWLEAPLMPWDLREQEQFERRKAALLAGEVLRVGGRSGRG